MKQLLLIGLGGFFGSICRYMVIGPWTQHWFDKFPGGTLIANVAGSFLIGLIVGLSIKSHQPTYWFTAIGFCGGFTTFSTFALDGSHLIKQNMWLTFAGYTTLNMVGALLLCIFGIWLGNKLI